MHLKRMELFGFKSFADKTELDLSPGIAAVIGPNGCGKSNLVDAVRWALGEQSVKNLRGNRMEEIIFSGSDSRKPLNFAEVSLTFSQAGARLNLEYDEVTVTRRLYRSGDSEYYINKSPCRLKDITELFLDTGIGKDLYSIIGQGRVEEIINSKPEDRREIFEEAAGILKYKLRKKEARRRLEETRENLVRVQDLVFELDNQVEPLEGQAEVARAYRAVKEKTDRAEQELLSYRLHLSQAELEKVEKQLQGAADALTEAAAQGGAREEQLQELRRQEQEQLSLREDLERRLNQLTREIEQQEGELRLLGERENRYQEQQEQNNIRAGQLTAALTRFEEEKAQLTTALSAKEAELLSEEENCKRLRQHLRELENSSLLAEVEEQQQGLFQARTGLEAAEAAVRELSPQLEKLQLKYGSLKEEDDELQKQLNQFTPRKDDLMRLVRETDEQIKEAAATLKKGEGEGKSLQQELNRLQQLDQQYREELRGLHSRLQLLQEQENSMSGYHRGVREVLQSKRPLSGIVGTVVDLIRVEEKYTRSIETALGGGLQYIVTETEEEAKEAIAYLKAGNRGWATFLPLGTIRVGKSGLERHPGWEKIEGVLGRAADLIQVDPVHKQAVEYLLGNILICRDLNSATRAARHIQYSCRIISLEGDMINPGGAIRGGSVPKSNAGQPLGRRQEIESLQEELDKLHKKRQSGEEKIAGIQQSLARNAESCQALQLHGETLNEQLKKHQNSLEDLGKEEQFLIRRRRDLGFEQLQGDEEELRRRLQGYRDQEKLCRGKIAAFQAALEGKKDLYQRSLTDKKEQEGRLTEALLRLNSCQEQAQVLREKLQKLQEEAARQEEEMTALNLEADRISSQLVANRNEQQQVLTTLEGLREESATLMASTEDHKKQAGMVKAGLIELEEEEKRWRNRLGRLERRERQLALDQARLQTDVSYQMMRYTDLFRSEELISIAEDFNPEECHRLVESLKEELESMGEVNLGAIEELARLQERIDFLNSQQEDLRKGELSLRKVLAEIDQRMEFYFTETFEVISKYMQQVFSELFQGGQVMLKLTDPSNILESGIEIVAQPPGKKLQNISLLSTGEKVLTALSLLFAILRYKPAPFYLLDEIESALDDINLHRFITYLKGAAINAQFLLITHRKRTMEESDVLFGVTMPEAGVSRLVSLKLDEIAS